MKKLHYVFKSINVLNCLLFLVVAGAAYYSITPFMNLPSGITLPAAGKDAPRTTELPAPLQRPSFADYVMISEQNLFHPERRIPPEKKEEKAAVAVILKPELVLYGTLIGQDLSVAYIEDKKAPYSTPGRGKRQIQLKKGESVGGYVLRDIEPTRIVLVKGEDKLVVTLDQEDKRRGDGIATAPLAGRAPAISSPAGALPLSPAISSPPQLVRPSATVEPAPAAAVVPSTTPSPSPSPIRRGLRSPLLPRNIRR